MSEQEAHAYAAFMADPSLATRANLARWRAAPGRIAEARIEEVLDYLARRYRWRKRSIQALRDVLDGKPNPMPATLDRFARKDNLVQRLLEEAAARGVGVSEGKPE